MNTSQTPERRLMRPAALLAALSALGLTFTLMVGPALAEHTGPLVTPTDVDGNQTCFALGDFTGELKVDEQEPNGTYDENSSNVEVTGTIPAGFEVTITSDGDEMSFQANALVSAVFVKGGPHGNLYDYTSIGGTDHDNGLVTPDGETISHVSFCFGELQEESEEPSVEESTEASVEESEEASMEESTEASVEESEEASMEESTEASVEESEAQSPEGSVLGGTGTPAPSTPDTAMGAANGPSPLPTIFFGAILLASLAGLAWVNVQAVRSRS